MPRNCHKEATVISSFVQYGGGGTGEGGGTLQLLHRFVSVGAHRTIMAFIEDFFFLRQQRRSIAETETLHLRLPKDEKGFFFLRKKRRLFFSLLDKTK